MKQIRLQITREAVNWQQVADVLRRSGLADYSAKEQQQIFENSAAVVFVYDLETIVGVGRALSDGICQAALYNIALDEEYQGHGIGRRLITSLLDQLKGQNIILYTHPRTVALYEKMGFLRSKTAMCLFSGSLEALAWKQKEGFLLPEQYRFETEYDRADMQTQARGKKGE